MSKTLPAALLAAGLLGGCAAAGGPYASLPAAPPPGAVAEAQPVVPTGDPALDAFLADLAAAVDREAWRAVAEAFDPDAYAEQFALVRRAAASDEAAAAQVVAETLGLGALLDGRPSVERLNQIRVVTLRTAERSPDGTAQITGDVRLADGRTLPLSFTVQTVGGAYRVVVPMG